MYDWLRRLAFLLPPELAHEVSLDAISVAERLGLTRLFVPEPTPSPVSVLGLTFPNAVGLAAGLDKNAEHIDGLAALGFGFIEVGTVTPRPQPGNPQPRLFRLPEHQAIINRMGFNNLGLEHCVAQLKAMRYQGILGVNVGKNFDTPVEDAAGDYRLGIRGTYAHASYLVVNVSSPNTPGLRSLQYGDQLKALLSEVKAEQGVQHQATGRYVPLLIKIAPDMSDDEVRLVAQALQEEGIDGVTATNTTLSREAVADSPLRAEAGGLSGAPVREASTRVVAALRDELRGKLPIIGVGGICSGADAVDKIAAGASLVQIYTGFIYRGPQLITEASEAIAVHQRAVTAAMTKS